MIIPIDHGNKQIKTQNYTFMSGLRESGVLPPFGGDVLQHKGVYYSISDTRFPYLRDKTQDDRFFTLTLFGIANEILNAGAYSAQDIIDVQLAVGLPPAHYGALCEKFERYFLRKDIVQFVFREQPFDIYISKVTCFPQAYAAAMTIYEQLVEAAKAVVVDIGGYTADYLIINYGKPNIDHCDSLEYGIIKLYNKIRSRLNSESSTLIDESDIDAVLSGKPIDINPSAKRTIEQMARDFVYRFLDVLRENEVELKTGKAVFVGGGAIRLRRFIEESGKVAFPIFIDALNANTTGFGILYRLQHGLVLWP